MNVETIITAGPIRAALLVSVVTTVRNEARNIAALLDSLAVQEPPIEVIVVDSDSEDATRDVVRTYEKRYDFVHLYVFGGTRGTGRNFGIRKARGDAVAFIDGDARACGSMTSSPAGRSRSATGRSRNSNESSSSSRARTSPIRPRTWPTAGPCSTRSAASTNGSSRPRTST